MKQRWSWELLYILVSYVTLHVNNVVRKSLSVEHLVHLGTFIENSLQCAANRCIFERVRPFCSIAAAAGTWRAEREGVDWWHMAAIKVESPPQWHLPEGREHCTLLCQRWGQSSAARSLFLSVYQHVSHFKLLDKQPVSSKSAMTGFWSC